MKIAIPVNEKNMDTMVNVSFGRTSFFLFYDTETKESEFMDNTAASSRGGAGIKAAQLVADQKADALLTPRCGKNATDVLVDAGVKIYKTKSVSVKETIKEFEAGELSLLDEVHPGLHGGN